MLVQLLKLKFIQLIPLMLCLACRSFYRHFQWLIMLHKSQKRSTASWTSRTAFHKAPMLNVLYTNAALLHNNIQELRTKTTVSSPDMLAISETWCRGGVMDSETALAEYRLLMEDNSDGRQGGDIAIMFKATICSVPHFLPDIPVNDTVACDIGNPESRLTVICVHRPLEWNPQTNLLFELCSRLSLTVSFAAS